MRTLTAFALGLLVAGLPLGAAAQPNKKQPDKKQFEKKQKSDADFVKAKPAVGDELPDLTVYSPEGKEVKLSSLRGSHVVLTFGCLT